MSKLYRREIVDQAKRRFRQGEMNPAEALLASAELLNEALRDFRGKAAAMRDEHGDRETADFARHELNDVISGLQDAIPPTIRAYNSLLRDKDQSGGAPGE